MHMSQRNLGAQIALSRVTRCKHRQAKAIKLSFDKQMREDKVAAVVALMRRTSEEVLRAQETREDEGSFQRGKRKTQSSAAAGGSKDRVAAVKRSRARTKLLQEHFTVHFPSRPSFLLIACRLQVATILRTGSAECPGDA